MRRETGLQITEKAWTAQVRQLAATLGYELQWHPWLAIHSPRGFPDLVLVNLWQKRIIFAELKTETGKASTQQIEWLDALRRCGQEAYLWRPSDWEVVVEVLREKAPAAEFRERVAAKEIQL